MLTETLIAATRAGAAELQRFFNGAFEISHKEGVNNLVTEADHAAERAIIGVIQAAFPDHFILSEKPEKLLPHRNLNGLLTLSTVR